MTKLCTHSDAYFEVSVFRAGELLEVKVQHGGHSWCHLRSEEWLLDLLSDDMEQSHDLHGQREVGPTLPLIL